MATDTGAHKRSSLQVSKYTGPHLTSPPPTFYKSYRSLLQKKGVFTSLQKLYHCKKKKNIISLHFCMSVVLLPFSFTTTSGWRLILGQQLRTYSGIIAVFHLFVCVFGAFSQEPNFLHCQGSTGVTAKLFLGRKQQKKNQIIGHETCSPGSDFDVKWWTLHRVCPTPVSCFAWCTIDVTNSAWPPARRPPTRPPRRRRRHCGCGASRRPAAKPLRRRRRGRGAKKEQGKKKGRKGKKERKEKER